MTSTFPLLTSNFSLQTSNFLKNVPRNPLLFGIFHRMDLVEKIGSGIKRIRQMCRDYEVAEPVFEISEHWVTTTFKRPTGQVTPQVGTKLALSQHQVEILDKCAEDQPLTTLIKIARRSDRTKFRNQVLSPLLEQGVLEMTIPDKPRSRNQKYRMTAKGKVLLAELEGAQK